MDAEPRRIFISYARKDGRQAARWLRDWLAEQLPAGSAVWQDDASLFGESPWDTTIRKAIDASDFLLLLLTPAALHSQNVAREWRTALRSGVCIQPLTLGAQKTEPGALPAQLRVRSVKDLDDADQRRWLLTHLQGPCERRPLPEPYGRPEPFTVVERPELETLVHTLCADQARCHLVHGGGGFGKTALVTRLCYEQDVLDHYEDGLFFLGVGQSGITEPGQRETIERIRERLGATSEPVPGSVDGRPSVLIIADDVWDPGALASLPSLGPSATLVVTSRNRDLIDERGPFNPMRRHRIGPLPESKALEVLRIGLAGDGDAVLRGLAACLQGWALALKLVGAWLAERVRDGQPLADAVTEAMERFEASGVTRFDDDPGMGMSSDGRDRAIEVTLDLSLSRLEPSTRDCCRSLGCFPPGVEIPQSVLGSLWMMPAMRLSKSTPGAIHDPDHHLRLMVRQGLIERVGARRAVRLHDLVHDYFVRDLGRDTELERGLHLALIELGGGAETPSSAYAWRWVGHHLIAAGQGKRLRDLLCDLDWLQRRIVGVVAGDKSQAADATPLLADFSRLDGARGLGASVLGLVASALRGAAHVLARRPDQLAAQLVTRIKLDSGSDPAVRGLVAACRRTLASRKLRPIRVELPDARSPLLLTLEGHEDRIGSVAISADGRFAASADNRHRLSFWDLGSGLRIAAREVGYQTQLAVIPGTRILISACDDRLARWDMTKGEQLAGTEAHASSYLGDEGLFVSKDGRRAGILGYDGLAIWDLDDLRPLYCIGGDRSLRSISGALLASLMSDLDEVLLFEKSSGEASRYWTAGLYACEPLERRRAGTGIDALCLPASGGDPVIAAEDGTLLRVTGREWDKPVGRVEQPYGLVFATNGAAILVADDDGWRRIIGEQIDSTRWPDDTEPMAISADGGLIAGVRDGRLLLVDTRAHRECLHEMPDGATRVALSGNGGTLVLYGKESYSSRGSGVWLCPASDPNELRALDAREFWHEPVVSGDGRFVSVDLLDDTALLSTDSGQPSATIARATGWRSAALNRDGSLLAMTNDDEIAILETTHGRRLLLLCGAGESVTQVAWTQADQVDGSASLFAAYEDGRVIEWQLRPSALPRIVVEQQLGNIKKLLASADGRHWVTTLDYGLESAGAAIWDGVCGDVLKTFGDEFSNEETALLISGDTRVVTEHEGSLLIWSVPGARRLRQLDGHRGDVTALAASANGHFLISGGADRRIRVWDLTIEE